MIAYDHSRRLQTLIAADLGVDRLQVSRSLATRLYCCVFADYMSNTAYQARLELFAGGTVVDSLSWWAGYSIVYTTVVPQPHPAWSVDKFYSEDAVGLRLVDTARPLVGDSLVIEDQVALGSEVAGQPNMCYDHLLIPFRLASPVDRATLTVEWVGVHNTMGAEKSYVFTALALA